MHKDYLETLHSTFLALFYFVNSSLIFAKLNDILYRIY